MCVTIPLMANAKKQKRSRSRRRSPQGESDGIYVLKLVTYFVLATVWVRFAAPLHIGAIMVPGLPVGFIVGAVLASRDRYQIDRKIEYVVLLAALVVSYFLPVGIVI